MINKTIASSLLAAQFFRLAADDGINKLDLDTSSFEFVPTATRRSSSLVAFSGFFINGRVTTIPFVISFSKTSKTSASMRAMPMQFTASCIGSQRSRLLAMLSVIDYLERDGELPPADGLVEHISYLTKGGVLTDRAAICKEYPAFRERAAKDLPYDLSLEVLAALEEVAA
ncbi:hypothetical protein [Paraburkholderia sp. BL10I2N1]|uniref:hypothetical protein n=1 Tax=Paraburkholderia sp. BL10I2N1 TaxID=1938796 RepID=UPI0010604921|nr:hypothetical protein [Paraburkholderia sp. BL10I2N1]TDN69092.1 hypothetical protein B0G77_2461 [Paraburkholderia sp. BL10I2N1]